MSLSQGLMLSNSEPLATTLETVAEHGYDFVELNMETAFSRNRLDPDHVAAQTDNHDLDIVVHLPYRIDPCSPHEHAREGACNELEAALDVAANAGAHRAIMHADTFVYGDSWETDRIRDRIISTADRLAAYGNTRGIDVAMENLKGDYYDVHTYAEIATHSQASLCLDTGHAAVSGMDLTDQASFLSEHAEAITHLHLNDTRRDDTDEHLPVGFGHLEFEALATAIIAQQWSGTATHEIWTPTTLGPVATAGKTVFDELLANATDTCQNGNTL